MSLWHPVTIAVPSPYSGFPERLAWCLAHKLFHSLTENDSDLVKPNTMANSPDLYVCRFMDTVSTTYGDAVVCGAMPYHIRRWCVIDDAFCPGISQESHLKGWDILTCNLRRHFDLAYSRPVNFRWAILGTALLRHRTATSGHRYRISGTPVSIGSMITISHHLVSDSSGADAEFRTIEGEEKDAPHQRHFHLNEDIGHAGILALQQELSMALW